jgi:hypothetical protein
MCDFRFRSQVDRRVVGVVYVTYWHRRKRPGSESVQSVRGQEWGTPTRLPSLRFPKFQLGPDCNLDHTVAPFSEDLIRLVDLIECEGVRQQRGQI